MTEAFDGSFGALPNVFPVFPLVGALLLPHGKLPLNIFEPRYRAMTEDALGAGRAIGMIQPDLGKPLTAVGPALFRVGCLGRLSSFSETEDGSYLVTLTGLIRFTVAQEIEPVRGYRRVRADLTSFQGDLDQVGTSTAGIDRGALMTALRAYFTQRGFDANWDAIDAMADDELVLTLSMVCPFEPAAKQAILEAPTFHERVETLLAILRIDAYDSPISGNDSNPRPLAS